MNGYNNISTMQFALPYRKYVEAVMRRYAKCVERCETPMLTGNVDNNNWCACDHAFKESEYSNVLLAVYTYPGSIAENVARATEEFNISQSIVWSEVKKAERMIARERGLID